MNRKDNMRYQERILWFENITTEITDGCGFSVDMTGIVPQDCYDLNVKLSLCYIEYPDTNVFFGSIIRILGDFGVRHNQFSSPNTYIQLGIINNPTTQNYGSIKLNEPNMMPKYSLSYEPIGGTPGPPT